MVNFSKFNKLLYLKNKINILNCEHEKRNSFIYIIIDYRLAYSFVCESSDLKLSWWCGI